MGKVLVTLNKSALSKILKSPKMEADLARRARNIADAAGEGMEADSQVGSRRARAEVRTDTPQAKNGEAKDRRLTRAIDAGRR